MVPPSALWSVTNSLRAELERQNTRVVGARGFIDTDMVLSIPVSKDATELAHPHRRRLERRYGRCSPTRHHQPTSSCAAVPCGSLTFRIAPLTRTEEH